MNTGDIVLIPFPFAELTNVKVRPAVVISITKDAYRDIVICAISSVVPRVLSDNEFIIQPGGKNNLRVTSVVKVDRIVTLKRKNVITQLGKLDNNQIRIFKTKFKLLID
ncbi:MAG: type II toxin-antitoxin system PemK/MazF family toxin [Bacteroidota bacterium]